MADSLRVERGKIGVVTVTYNSEPVLRDFFDSISGQSYPNFVVYVVDNASGDASVRIAREQSSFPVVVIPNRDNCGVAEGNNQGIRAALADGCECVLLLNNDTVFPPDLFAALYAGLDRHHCEMTTAKMYFHDTSDMIWAAGGYFEPWLAYHTRHYGIFRKDIGQFDRARRVTYTPTCCLLVRRTVFDQIGLMDSRYFVYCDDVDFLYRCLRRKLKLWYLPEARLWHKVSSLTEAESTSFAIRYLHRNRIYFLRKHMPRWFALACYWQIQGRSALAYLLRRNSREKWDVRRNAARDGWNMSLGTAVQWR